MVTIENRRFSIPQICESGQCFRLDPAGGDTYELIAGDRWLGIRAGEEETVLSCPQEEYEEFWKSYFDLETDYQHYLNRISGDDLYLTEAARFGSGIRILRQDTWEMIITFILSQQNNIRRIKGLIRALSERYGTRCRKPDGTAYYAFPDVQSLAAASEEELREMKLKEAAKKAEDGIEETLAYCDFPPEHWTRIRTNNVMERLNREIRRRTRIVGTFPDSNSALMLVCARLRHGAGTQWGNKKYMNMKHLEAALEDASIAG